MAESADNKPKVVVGGVKVPHNLNMPLIIAIVVVIVLGLGGFLYYQAHHKTMDTQVTYSAAQKDALLRQAAPLLESTNTVKLAKIADEIQTIKGHETDPNFLYILTTYYALASDYNKATDYYTKLSAVYNPKTGYSPIISRYTVSLKGVQNQINFIKVREKEVKKNSFSVQEPK